MSKIPFWANGIPMLILFTTDFPFTNEIIHFINSEKVKEHFFVAHF